MPRFSDGPTGSIAKLPPPTTGTKKLYFDDHKNSPTGFGMRVTAKGQRVFILRYSADGRRRLKTIGEWPVWTLDAARIEAQVTLRDLAAGSDPLEEKRLRRDEHTIADLATEWLSKYATGLKSERDIRSAMTNDVIPAIGTMKLSDLRRINVIEMVEAKAKTAPRSAALLLQYTRAMLNFACTREYVTGNCLAGLKAQDILVAGRKDVLKPVQRARILDDDEIRSFWNNANHANLHPLTVLALRLILATGQRPGEIAAMHIDEISGDVWTIPVARRGKSENSHAVPLGDLALRLINAAKVEKNRLGERRNKPSTGFLFEARPGAPITNATLGKAITRAAVPLGIKHVERWGRWTPHDLRRTMRTGLSACRIAPHIAELAIGHGKKGLIKTYDQHEFGEEIRHALEQWEKRLLRIIKGADYENVAQLEARS
jgi:integrase